MYHVKLEKFQGPFSLLVELIEDRKLSINDIALSDVTEQFLHYIEQVERRFPEELADFLVVASRLLWLKSRTLLPSVEPDDEEGNLEAQLKLYREFVEASRTLETILEQHHVAYSRNVVPSQLPSVFSPPPSLNTSVLQASMMDVLSKLQPILALPKTLMERAVSLEQQMERLTKRIQKKAVLHFSELAGSGVPKVEVVLHFLALLELLKRRMVLVSQAKPFHDILIKRV